MIKKCIFSEKALLNFIFYIALFFSLNTSLKSACRGNVNFNGANIININNIYYAPFLNFTDDGASDSDGITSNGTISVAKLDPDMPWEYTTDNGATWTNGSTVNADGISSFELPLSNTVALDTNVNPTQESPTTTSLDGVSTQRAVVYFELTTESTYNGSNQLIFEAGGSQVGMAFFQNDASLNFIVDHQSPPNEDSSIDFSVTNILTEDTRYVVILEILINTAASSGVRFYVGEYSNGIYPDTLTKYSGTWSSGATDWSGNNGVTWGGSSVDATTVAKGVNTYNYVTFGGIFHEGKFYTGLGKNDIIVTVAGANEFSNTHIQARQLTDLPGTVYVESYLKTHEGNITFNP